MKIEKITEQKKRFLDLLLLADEQESMIDRYLDEGDMYALYDDEFTTLMHLFPLTRNFINKTSAEVLHMLRCLQVLVY